MFFSSSCVRVACVLTRAIVVVWNRSRLYDEVIYARPYMTYDMSTGVCMKAGADTGETLVVRDVPLKPPFLLVLSRRVFLTTAYRLVFVCSSRPHAKGHADFQLGDNVVQKLHVGRDIPNFLPST